MKKIFLVFASMALAGTGISAQGITVHCKPYSDWTAANIHFWNTNNGNIPASTTWPGLAMTPEADGWYYYIFSSATSVNVVFNNNGSGGEQTVDASRSGSDGWCVVGGHDGSGKHTVTWYGSKPANRWVSLNNVANSYGLLSRNVRIYLPASYDSQPATTYRVLYFHDGQNLFQASESFGGVEWQLDENYDSLVSAGSIDEAILVGIWNTADRMAEYSTRDPKAAAYYNFIANDLKPLIDATCRTKPEARYTGIGGSSLGGLVSAWMAWNHPEKFGICAPVSPSFWYESVAFLNAVLGYSGGIKATRYWLYAGSSEGSNMQGYATDFFNTLTGSGWRHPDDADLMITSGGAHNEYYWELQCDEMLSFMLKPGAVPPGGGTSVPVPGSAPAAITGNPISCSAGALTIRLSNGRQQFELTLVDSRGRVVVTVNGFGTARVAMKKYAPGAYIALVESGKQRFARRAFALR